MSAQITISTDFRLNYSRADTSDNFILANEYNFFSIFEFSNNYSVIKNITENQTSFYTITKFELIEAKDSLNQKYSIETYSITSDIGNKYIMHCDFKKKVVKFININDPKYAFILLIKTVFRNEN